MDRICGIRGCDSPVLARHYCAKHYHRWHRHGDPLYINPKNVRGRAPNERFWALVKQGPNCWEWQGLRQRYGIFRVNARTIVKAHRWAWEQANGPIPEGMLVLHHCDNPPCVKTDPDSRYPEGHLFLGTQADNMNDMDAKGRRVTHTGPRVNYRGSINRGAKLTEDQIPLIRRLHADGTPLLEIAAKFGVGQNAIFKVVHRTSWRHVP